MLDEIDQAVRVEVRHADRPYPTLLVEVLHGAPRAVNVAVRLVDQVQVEVVEAEPPQRGVEGVTGGFLTGVLHPQFGRDEQFVSRDAARGDRPPDGLLVAVGGGGVQHSVAGGQGVENDLLGLLGGDLVDPEAEGRHRHTVVQGDLRDVRGH